MKFLVDECLSPVLAKRARERGHGESAHVIWMGCGGMTDWALKDFALGGDWTLVTKNSVDFRGAADDPGKRGQYADVSIHAGLVCLNGPESMDRAMQIELFDHAMDAIATEGDLVNQVLEVTAGPNGVTIDRYGLPADDEAAAGSK